MSDRIRVSGLRVPCHIGTTQTERADPQLLLVDVEIAVDLRAAAKSQELRHTVDYVEVAKTVRRIATSEWVLIEAFASAVAEELHTSGVSSVRVRVAKPAAALMMQSNEVWVEVIR